MALKKTSLIGLTIVAVWCLLPLLAAEGAAPAVEVEIQSRFTGSSALGADGARVSQDSSLVDLTIPLAGSGHLGLGADLIVQRLGFHFSETGGSFPGGTAPLAAAEVATLKPTVIFHPTPRWTLVGSGTVQYAGGDHALSGDSRLFSGSVGAIYQHAPERKIGLGIQVAGRLKAAARIIPFPLIDWRISDRWSLTALDGESGTLGCRMTDTMRVIGRLEFQSQDIRLKRSSSIPSGIMRYEAFPLSVGLEFRPNKHLTVTVDGGAALAQQYRFEDERGHLLRAGEIHSPWIGTLDFDYDF